MTRPPFEVADIVRTAGSRFRQRVFLNTTVAVRLHLRQGPKPGVVAAQLNAELWSHPYVHASGGLKNKIGFMASDSETNSRKARTICAEQEVSKRSGRRIGPSGKARSTRKRMEALINFRRRTTQFPVVAANFSRKTEPLI